MTWEPLPLDIAEWMGMDDDSLRLAHTTSVGDLSQAGSHANNEDAAA